MSPEEIANILGAVRVAFRHYSSTDTSDIEREQICLSLMTLLPEADGKVAQDILFHTRESQKAQLLMGEVLGKPVPPSITLGDGANSP